MIMNEQIDKILEEIDTIKFHLNRVENTLLDVMSDSKKKSEVSPGQMEFSFMKETEQKIETPVIEKSKRTRKKKKIESKIETPDIKNDQKKIEKPIEVDNYILTDLAQGYSEQDLINNGWTRELLIQHGYLVKVKTQQGVSENNKMDLEGVNKLIMDEYERLGSKASDLTRIKEIIKKYNNNCDSLTTLDPNKYDTVLSEVRGLK